LLSLGKRADVGFGAQSSSGAKRRDVPAAASAGKIVNVAAFGARGDGVKDDTAAIQAAINAASAGSTIYFPAGTYLVSGLILERRSGLSLAGEGHQSIIQQKAGGSRLLTCNACRDIAIEKLTFDANGIHAYGGVVFYASERIRIDHNWYIDSAPKPLGATDRYSFVFGKGAAPSQDIQIRHNIIEDLQLEVDHSRRVVIEGNLVSRAVQAGGIGIFSVGDGAVAEDYLITRNTIVDPYGSGFSVLIDPPKSRNCVFRNITIADNEIVLSKRASYGVRIGTGDNSQATAGNVFDDIVIKNNRIRIAAGAPAARQMIFANTSTAAAIVFNRLTVSGNRVDGEGGSKHFAIDLRRVQHSTVTANTIRNARKGISLVRDLRANEIRDNVVEAGEIAYALEDSLGENKAVNNQIVGSPKTSWKTSRLKATDRFEP
jgi:polygalacturonase